MLSLKKLVEGNTLLLIEKGKKHPCFWTNELKLIWNFFQSRPARSNKKSALEAKTSMKKRHLCWRTTRSQSRKIYMKSSTGTNRAHKFIFINHFVILNQFLLITKASLKFFEPKLWPKHLNSWSGASSKAKKSLRPFNHFRRSCSDGWTWYRSMEIFG